MYGLKLPKIMKNIDVLIGNFDHAIFLSIVEALFLVRPKLGRYRNFKPNFKRLHRSNNTQNVFNQGKIGARLNWLAAPIVCGSEPVMGALENSTSNNHSSVGSSSDKCAFSNSGNSAEGVTKKDTVMTTS